MGFTSKPGESCHRVAEGGRRHRSKIRRDARSPSDWIRVLIDSYHDKRTAYEFAVNPAGVKQDRYWFNDTERDDSWDAVWDVKVSREDDGWTIEDSFVLARELAARGVDLIDCSSGGIRAENSMMDYKKTRTKLKRGHQVPYAEAIRREAGIPTIVTVDDRTHREETEWHYTMEPSPSGTVLTESFQFLWCPTLDRVVELLLPRGRQVERGMKETLRRLKVAAEAHQATDPV